MSSTIGAKLGPINESVLLAVALGVNLNSGNTDTQAVLEPWVSGADFIVDSVIVTNPSRSMTTATVGVFSAASAGGQAFMANQAITALVNPKDYVRVGPSSASTTTGAISANGTAIASAPFVRCGTAQGAAATADVYIYGRTTST
jgi:hypothetical protein